MAAPHVSIIIPAYNCEQFIRPMLQSVVDQTAKNFEVIVIDDGSTDATSSIVGEMIRICGRIRLIEQENRGPGMARNVGLENALGEYVVFLDADDLIDPNLIAHAYTRAKETDADIVIYKMRLLDMEDEIVKPLPDNWNAADFPAEFAPVDHADVLFDSFKNWPPDKLFRRDFLKQNEIIFPPLYRTEDLLFTCSALASAQKIALLDEELYTYRVNIATSSTQNIDNAPLDFYESCRLLKAYLDYRGLFDTFRKSYNNWVGLCLIVNLLGMKTARGFIRAYDTLHHWGMIELGLDNVKLDDFLDPERFDLVQCINNDDLATGMFRFWHYDKKCAEKDHRQRLETALNDVTSSTSFKVGSTLLKLPTKLKDARNAGANAASKPRPRKRTS